MQDAICFLYKRRDPLLLDKMVTLVCQDYKLPKRCIFPLAASIVLF